MNNLTKDNEVLHQDMVDYKKAFEFLHEKFKDLKVFKKKQNIERESTNRKS